jgi:ribosomal protein S18 acetylase RimI-like enzyme
MNIRAIREEDYVRVIDVLIEWWSGRDLSDLLPRLFFQHFQETSFIMEEKGEIVGFLVGFVSQTKPSEAYIHFVGVHPNYRKQHIGTKLYDYFFQCVCGKGCNVVKCITSPVNKVSIKYHTKVGFRIEEGDAVVDGVHVHSNYDGRGNNRVVFCKEI